MDFLHKVQAVVVLDSDGNRLFAKYYPILTEDAKGSSAAVKTGSESIEAATTPWGSLDRQRALEKYVHDKARDPKRGGSGADGDVMLYEGKAILFQVDPEVTFVVVGSAEENEMVLYAVLQCLVESLQQLLKASPIDKRTLLEKYTALLLVVDEMIDDGVIIETVSSFVVGDVGPFESEGGAEGAKKALSSINKYLKQNL
jgi:hypothetical protein